MLVTDLDGTLTRTDGAVCSAAVEMLHRLGDAKVVRAIATGRSFYAACSLLDPEFPIDYLIFSSGAGIFDWKTREHLVSHHLTVEQIRGVQETLLQKNLDFMLHRPIPDNHLFYVFRGTNPSHDFMLRCEKLRHFASDWSHEYKLESATQFLLVAPVNLAAALLEMLRADFPDCSVIRATSPLGKGFVWFEIFSKKVSKSQGADWLCRLKAISAEHVLAVGNDYNDEDLLAWAGTSFLVANAPQDLRDRFAGVRSNDDRGFVHAVENWLVKRASFETGSR